MVKPSYSHAFLSYRLFVVDAEVKNFYRLIQGDCLQVLPTLQDKSIDLILTDPPYGITKAKWDIVPDKKCFDEMFRVSKNQIIFGGNYFDLPKKGGWIVWYKRPFLKRVNPLELIWTSFDMQHHEFLDYTYAGNYEGFNGQNIQPNYKKKKVFFTSQKPVAVMKWILEKHSKEQDLILDCFLGTGTTMIACQDLERNCVGIEINPEYCDIVKKRCFGRQFLDHEVEYSFEVFGE